MLAYGGLLNLPDEFIISLLSCWVEYRALGRLDSACCNASSRAVFLRVVQRTTVQGYEYNVDRFNLPQFWFYKRGVVQFSAIRVRGASNALNLLNKSGNNLKYLAWEGLNTPKFGAQLCEFVKGLEAGLSGLTLACLAIDLNPYDRYKPHVRVEQIAPLFHASPNMQMLNLYDFLVFAEMFLHVPHSLTTLDVTYGRFFKQDSDFDLTNTFQNLANLKQLYLSCSDIPNDVFISIGKYCTKLEVISLFYDGDVSVGAFVDVFSSCTHLKTVTMSCCRQLSDDALCHLRSVLFLSLTRCDKVTERGVRQLVRNNPDLRTLQLSECDKLSTSCCSFWEARYP